MNKPEQPQVNVADAKRRLLEEAGRVEFLKPLRQHPWATVGSAAVLGALAAAVSDVMSRKSQEKHTVATVDGVKYVSKAQVKEPGMFAVLQPILFRGAQLAVNWWMAKQQAQESQHTNPPPSQPSPVAEASQASSAEPI